MLVENLRAVTLPRLAVIDLEAPLRDAASLLAQPGIGLVIVCSKISATGVLSKSDIVRHLAAGGRAETSVAFLMSRPFVSCEPSDRVCDVWQTMTERKLQNIPVLGADRMPLGVLDIRDAMKALYDHMQFEEQMLVDYIAGTGYR
jgi:CBS domain-containing protein